MPYTIDRDIEDVKAQQLKTILGKHFITKIMEADLQEGQDFGIYSVKPFNVGVRLRRFKHFIKDARARDMTKFCFGHVQKIVYCIMPRQCFAHEQKIIDCIMKSMFDTCVEDRLMQSRSLHDSRHFHDRIIPGQESDGEVAASTIVSTPSILSTIVGIPPFHKKYSGIL